MTAEAASYAIDQQIDGWRWRVINPDGILLAQGLAASERQATASARLFGGVWEALRRKARKR